MEEEENPHKYIDELCKKMYYKTSVNKNRVGNKSLRLSRREVVTEAKKKNLLRICFRIPLFIWNLENEITYRVPSLNMRKKAI